MEFERKSSGVAKGGLTTGIIGTSLGALALLGGGANMLTNGLGRNNAVEVVPVPVGGNFGWGRGEGCCSEDHFVNRYELKLEQENAAKDSEIALLKANTYNDQKSIELYRYVDGRFREFEQALASQAVFNQKTSDDVQRVQANLDCCCDKMKMALDNEARERRCEDNTIVNYANNTFYAKLTADITTGTTTTPQRVYNPLRNDCGCGNRVIE